MKTWLQTKPFAGSLAAVAIIASLVNSSVFAQGKKDKPFLTCSEVRNRVGLFLDLHYTFRNFDNEISKRTFKKIFETFDAGKNYFLASDLEEFQSMSDKIDDQLLKADCSFVENVHKKFQQRVKERSETIQTLLSKTFKFDVVDELFVGKVDWAKNNAELAERWRKRIKFQVLNLKDVEGEAKARERLKKRYEQAKKSLMEQDSDDIYDVFLNSFSAALDPHSSHFLPAEQEDFTIRLGNQLEGIGATLQEEDGYIMVQALIPGGAAFRDGRLKVSDKIVAVDPGDGTGITDLIDMEVGKAVRYIRGKKGTTVKLTVLRKTESGNERLTINIVRDAVKITAGEAKGDTTTIGKYKVGVIRLPAFYTDFSCRTKNNNECSGSSQHVLREIKKLQAQKIDGLVLDLRSNGGGDLSESIRLSGLFIPEGTVVQTVDRQRSARANQDTDPSVQYDGPLVVMINKYSASASEIVSGALQDYKRAIIVGDSHSYGKATVQVLQDLPGTQGRQSNGAIKVTQAKFYRPSGTTNQEQGVFSDIAIPSILEVFEIGEKENDFPLKPDTIQKASDLKTFQDFEKILPKLSQMSKDRISKSKEWKEQLDKIEKAKLEKDKQTASLKEDIKKSQERKKEKEQEEKETKELREKGDDNPVIRKSDIQLFEATNILVDAIEAVGSKSWVKNR
jgi:carboxyl-terminal processing protease